MHTRPVWTVSQSASQSVHQPAIAHADKKREGGREVRENLVAPWPWPWLVGPVGGPLCTNCLHVCLPAAVQQGVGHRVKSVHTLVWYVHVPQKAK